MKAESCRLIPRKLATNHEHLLMENFEVASSVLCMGRKTSLCATAILNFCAIAVKRFSYFVTTTIKTFATHRLH